MLVVGAAVMDTLLLEGLIETVPALLAPKVEENPSRGFCLRHSPSRAEALFTKTVPARM